MQCLGGCRECGSIQLGGDCEGKHNPCPMARQARTSKRDAAWQAEGLSVEASPGACLGQ